MVHVYSGGRWLLGYTKHDEIYHTTPIQHLEFIKYCKSEGWRGAVLGILLEIMRKMLPGKWNGYYTLLVLYAGYQYL